MAKLIKKSVGKGGTNQMWETISRLYEAGLTQIGARQAASGQLVTNPHDREALARLLSRINRI